MKQFLKWVIIMMLVNVGTAIAAKLGAFHALLEKDASYLGIATIIYFYGISCFCGRAVYDACKDTLSKKEKFKLMVRRYEVVCLSCENCLGLGMAGTLVGFIMMLAGFEGLDVNNSATIQALLESLGRSMGTALYTTIVGLICGMILKQQGMILGMEIQELGRELDREAGTNE
jgi:hypothetical protein